MARRDLRARGDVRSGHARARRPALVVLLVAVAALLTGCVGIPTSGPIGTGEVVLNEPGVAFPLANDPVPDATPGEVVEGFLLAGAAGLYDEFAVARRFLTIRAATEWEPRSRVVVYSLQAGGPEITPRADGTVVVSVPVAATVDRWGRYVEAVPGSREEVVFQLARDGAGQWRIMRLDDGVLIAAPNFDALFRSTAIYFVTPDRQRLVPEVRWFPTRNQATHAVEALLAGPSDWLRDAVVTGAPEGARLSTNAVTVEFGVAVVDLSAEVRLADQADRGLLQAQLEAVLERLPGVLVSEVQVLVGGVPWEPPGAPDLVGDVAPEAGPYVLADGRLAVLENGQLQPVPDAAPLTGLLASDPAVGFDGRIRVVLDGASRLVLLPEGGEPPRELLAGSTLVAPSVDRHGWVWTAERSSAGELRAVLPSGEQVAVDADWLAGRTIRSLRVAREGARIAVVSAGPDGEVVVDAAGIVRDAGGVPQLLTQPMRVGAALEDAVEVVWTDEGTLGVLGTSGTLSVPTAHLVPLGGPTQALSLVDATAGIAAGRGERALYVVSVDGVLYSRQNQSWVVVAEGVRDPTFPG